MGCEIGGESGLDVARVKPKPWLGGIRPVRQATGTHPYGQRRPPTSGWGRGGGRLEVILLTGGRRPKGLDCIGRDA